MTDLVTPSIAVAKNVAIENNTVGSISYRSIGLIALAVVFVLVIAWMYYKMKGKDERIGALENEIRRRAKGAGPPDIESGEAEKDQTEKKSAPEKKSAEKNPAEKNPTERAAKKKSSNEHEQIARTVDDDELDKYIK